MALKTHQQMALAIALSGLPLAAAETAPCDDATAEQRAAAQTLIEGALDLTRGITSYTEMAMTIHRPDFERRLELAAWTRGREDALIRFTAPAKDAGVATLKTGEHMWTFTPQLKRAIKLPASMRSNSWAGSDFSYNDLSRTDQYLSYYAFCVTGTEERDGRTIHTLELVPHDDAPVVWGKETMVMRDDYVTLRQTFYDQSMAPLKEMRTVEIGELGGRTIPLAMRMAEIDEQDRWTEVRYLKADFDAQVEDSMFTKFALRGEP